MKKKTRRFYKNMEQEPVLQDYKLDKDNLYQLYKM